MTHFKKVQLEDIRTIQELANEIWKEHYPAIISMEQIEYMLEKMYNTERITDELTTYTLIFEEQKAIGFYSMYEREAGDYFLSKFYILKDYRGREIATSAWTHLLKTCKTSSKISLQVNRKNIRAINFYFKMGFKILEAKDFSIGNGFTMDDFIMQKKIV